MNDARPHLDESALVRRLNAAMAASTSPDGHINHEWLALHVWLAHDDMMRACLMATATNKDATGGSTPNLPGACQRLFRRVLPATLPLMQEFADPQMFRICRESGFFENVVADPDFIRSALAAGIPVCREEMIRLSRPVIPAGRDHYFRDSRHYRLPLLH